MAVITSLVFAVWDLIEFHSWGGTLRLIMTVGAVLYLNEIIGLALSRYELSIAKAEAELAYRLDFQQVS